MRVLGTFVNFGSASDHLYWQGHVMRAAWRERRRLEAAQEQPRKPPQRSASETQRRVPRVAPCAR